nr:ATP-binding protein [Candidatus Chloroploca mongolica]
MPARYTYLHLLSDCIADMLRLLEQMQDAEMVIYNIQLAVHEACTNIVRHAYENKGEGRILITLTLSFDPPQLTIELQDTGKPFDAESYAPPDLDDVPIGGMGIFLIRNLMDDVTYTPSPGRNHWNLTKSLLVKGI